MKEAEKMIAFGPVPSRRLGQSLGINNIPPKICTYSCIYCQLGRTKNMQITRRKFYTPKEIFIDVEKKVKSTKEKGEKIDYLTFVPDGEPTLDSNISEEIEELKSLGIKMAVISNSSLIWQEDVRYDLSNVDWISLKVDAVTQGIWRKINRPYKDLNLNKILKGISEFANSFNGEFTTETMLIQNINDNNDELKKVATFISGLKPKKSYISIPTRPPAENWVKPVTENTINLAYQLFKDKSIVVEYLIGYEGNAFAFSGNIEEDLLSITSVHPMREEAVNKFLKKANGDWNVIEKLIAEDKLVETHYKDNKFYIRKIKS